MPETLPTESLRSLFDGQRAAFLRGAPDYDQRMEALRTLRDGLRAHQEELAGAISEDFGGRALEETLSLELFPLYDQIRHARRHLRDWMRRRHVPSSWFLQPSRAWYQYQPLGAVGVIGAWNYTLYLTLGPLVDALAAGNHVLVKPSEITPRAAEALARMLNRSFAPEYVHCVTGGPELGRAFTQLPFDHLFFTGSTRVGQLVMESAARNLTPVTLELGGKSPVILHESYPVRRAAIRILAGKLYNAGQTCVAPDYLLLPAGREREFESEALRAVETLYPRGLAGPDYTRIVNPFHDERLRATLRDAEQRGARLRPLVPARAALGRDGDPSARLPETAVAGRIFPPTLVFDPTPEMTVLREEIFGPILPVVTYRTLDDAIAYVNARPRPLALYYFDQDRRRVDHVLNRTISGGVTVNDCLFHLAQANLPFGGVGPSGMGQYHGFDGFATFSKKRGVMYQGRAASTALIRAPFTARTRAVIRGMIRLAGG